MPVRRRLSRKRTNRKQNLRKRTSKPRRKRSRRRSIKRGVSGRVTSAHTGPSVGNNGVPTNSYLSANVEIQEEALRTVGYIMTAVAAGHTADPIPVKLKERNVKDFILYQRTRRDDLGAVAYKSEVDSMTEKFSNNPREALLFFNSEVSKFRTLREQENKGARERAENARSGMYHTSTP